MMAAYEDSLYVLKVLIPLRVRGLIVFVNEVEEFEKTPVELLRNGVGAFLVHVLGTKKTTRLKIKSL